MDFNRQNIIFNYEERYVTGLPPKMPLPAANVALSISRCARDHCFSRFYDLLMCDVELLSDSMVREMHLYPERLAKIDRLSLKLARVAAPAMVDELENNMDLLIATVAETARR